VIDLSADVGVTAVKVPSGLTSAAGSVTVSAAAAAVETSGDNVVSDIDIMLHFYSTCTIYKIQV
jgi:hypothetical protein